MKTKWQMDEKQNEWIEKWTKKNWKEICGTKKYVVTECTFYSSLCDVTKLFPTRTFPGQAGMSKLYVKGFYPRYERCNEACKNCKNLSCQITCNKFQFNSQFKRPDSIQFSLFHHRLLASVSHACRTGRHPLSTQAQSRYWQDSSISHDLLHWLCGCRFQPSIQYIEIFNAVFLLKTYVFFLWNLDVLYLF